MRLTISKKIGLLLFLMVIVAVANILIIYYHQNLQIFDSHILNIAGRQRMLSQKISKLALSVANGNDSDRQFLRDAIGLYDSSLKILHYGGSMKEHIMPPVPGIMKNLFEKNKGIWDLFKENTMIIVKENRDNPIFSEAISFVEANDELLLERSNDVVNAYKSLPNAKEFAHEINVAGRQRMLSEKISKYDHKIAIWGDVGTLKKLQTVMELYEKSFLALSDGGVSIPWGKEIKVPPPSVKEALGSFEDLWKEFKLKLNVIQKTSRDNRVFSEAIDYIRQNNDELLRISDEVTVTFEQIFSEKVFRLRILLIIMLVFDIFIFLIGCVMAVRIAKPIRDLSKFARKVGEGDFSQKIDIPGSEDETGDLANAFDKMIDDLQKTTVSKNYLDNILKSMTGSLVVLNPDENIQRVNEATCSLLGYQENELIGKPIITILEDDFKGIGLNELIKKGFISNVEKFYLSKDGRRIPILISCSVMRDSNGKVQGIVCVAKDITEYKRTKEALFNKTKLMQLFQKITITSNEASTVEEALQICLEKVCKYMGWPIGHVYLTDSTGKLTPSSLWHIENPEQFEEFRKVTEVTPFDPGVGLPGRVLAHGKPAWIKDVTKDPNFLRAKLAKNIGVKAGFALPMLEGKKVVAVLEFFSEKAIEPDESLLAALSNLGIQLGRLTERKRAEAEMKELNRSLEKFSSEMEHLAGERAKQLVHADRMVSIGTLAAGVAHEINNPVGFISSNLQIFERLWARSIKTCVEKAKEENEDKNLSFALDEMPRMVETMREGTKRISTIVRKLNGFSRVQEEIFEMASISKCIKAAVTFCSFNSTMKYKVDVQVHVPEDIPNIRMHRTEIEQVFVNLFNNAAYAMEGIIDDRKLTLKISAALAEDEVVIETTDNGIGMNEMSLDKIFNPFYTTKEAGQGTGLGLSICYGIIKKHRGTIKASSTSDEGTIFTVTLPLDPQKKERRKKNEKSPGGLRKEDKLVLA